MTRIIGGSARGRTLATPAGLATRPTSDRAREGLFNSLGNLSGLTFLDLYAGTGAVGLEALSRGAASATLVETDRAALSAIRANIDALGFAGATVSPLSVERFLAAAAQSAAAQSAAAQSAAAQSAAAQSAAAQSAAARPSAARPSAARPFDVVFVDAPYADDLTGVLVSALPVIGDRLVVERDTRDGEPAAPHGIEWIKSRRYGEATLWYGARP